jgi:hypothetical protein
MKRFALLIIAVMLAVTFNAASAEEKAAPEASKCKKSSTCLDSATKVEFEKLKLKYELSVVDLNAEKKQIQEALMKELASEEMSKKSIDKLVKSMNANHAKLLDAKMDYVLKVKKVLPPDHFNKFLHKQHAKKSSCSCSCCSSGSCSCCKRGSGCSHGTAHKCSSSCAHKSASCPMAGTKGHSCTSACTTAAKTGCKATCKTPCKATKK